MKVKSLLIMMLLLFVFAAAAQADLLCIKKKQKVKGGRVTLSGALKTADSACPAGYAQVLDTAVFTGPRGATGAQGPAGKVDWSSCYIKQESFVSSSGFAGGMVTCTDPQDDFMLADGYSYTPENVEVYLDNRQFFVMAGSDPDVPMGIYVYTGCLDLTADYVLTISISCCSRQ